MKTLIITGGTKGIGRAIVEKFLAEGFQVFTCGSSQSSVQELLSAGLPNIMVDQVDVSQKSEIQKWASEILGIIGEPDVLVNNAGIFVPGGIGEEKDGDFEAMMSTNLASAYHCTRAFLPSMKARKAGHIFNICSTASIVGYTNGGSYCISKFGLLGMSKVLREELKPFGIKVTSILPGATYTDSWSSSGMPPERFMKASEVAELVWASYNLGPGTVVEEILMRPLLGDIS